LAAERGYRLCKTDPSGFVKQTDPYSPPSHDVAVCIKAFSAMARIKLRPTDAQRRPASARTRSADLKLSPPAPKFRPEDAKARVRLQEALEYAAGTPGNHVVNRLVAAGHAGLFEILSGEFDAAGTVVLLPEDLIGDADGDGQNRWYRFPRLMRQCASVGSYWPRRKINANPLQRVEAADRRAILAHAVRLARLRTAWGRNELETVRLTFAALAKFLLGKDKKAARDFHQAQRLAEERGEQFYVDEIRAFFRECIVEGDWERRAGQVLQGKEALLKAFGEKIAPRGAEPS
jgi:hypothetical protein